MAITPDFYEPKNVSYPSGNDFSKNQIISQHRFFFALSSCLVSDYQTKTFYTIRAFFFQSIQMCWPL